MLKKQWERFISVITALTLLLALPISVYVTADNFVPENLLITDLASKKTVVKNISAGNVYEHNQFNGAGALAAINDGDTATKKDAYGANDWGHHSGIVFELNTATYCDKVSLFAGYAEMTDTYDVYAAETEADLYNTENKIGSGIVCNGTEQTVTVSKTVKYLAVFLTDYTYNGRIAEIQLWSGEKKDDTEEPGSSFTPENLLKTDLASKKTVVKNINDGTVQDHINFDGNGTVAIINDGDTETKKDAYGANDWGNHSGIVFQLNTASYCNKVTIFAGYAEMTDTYDVYVSETEEDLYSPANKVGEGIVCNGTEQTVTFGKTVKYLAVFLTDYTYNGRIAEIQLWSAQKPTDTQEPDPSSFTPENLLKTDLASKKTVVKNISDGTVQDHANFDGNGTVAIINDGDTDTKKDAYGANDWGNHSGIVFQLNSAAYCGKVSLFAGYAEMTDTYDVYAAETEEDLYSAENKIGSGIVCDGTEQTVTVGKTVKYLAVFLTDYTYNGRIAEIQLWSAKVPDETPEDPSAFTPENLLKTDLASKKAIIKSILTGEVSDHNQFDGNGVLAILNDGDTDTKKDAYGANDWNNHSGVLFRLNNVTYCDKVTIFAGFPELADTFDVYASTTEEDLYDSTNKIGSGIVCDGSGQTVTVGKNVKYLAVFLVGYTGNGRVAEIELWSAKMPDDYDPTEPSDPTEPDPTPSDETDKTNHSNFISRHFASSAGVLQDVKSGDFTDGDRFTQGNAKALSLAIDGDTTAFFDVYGALDWEYPKNVGARYQLDGVYPVKTAQITAGDPARPVKVAVYASDSVGTLFKAENLLQTVSCKGETVSVKVGKDISSVAFLIVGYDMSSCATVAEFDLTGSDKAVQKKVISWSKAPSGGNLLSSATAWEIVAPGGDFLSAKKFDYRFMDVSTETSLSKLTDGDLSRHYDIWSLTQTDKPGVLYDLGAYYDLTYLHAFAGASGSELITNYGYRIYASATLENLFKSASLVADYSNAEDTTNEFAQNVNIGKVRYVAFFLTASSDGAWRMREFAAYGKKSADQSEPPVQASIIEELEAEYYGVATDNLADPVYMGASDYVIALTDGKRDAVEFWGGSDIGNSKFVFIYNLYANYDLSGVEIFAFADNIEEDSGIHKGIRSAKVYASRKLDDLFTSEPIVLKEDYDDPKTADENAYYASDAKPEWKGVRYIAYVFTIGDSRYGACRLEELRAFGVESAVQDKEEEEAVLPEYIDLEGEEGVVLRIYALDKKDDLSKLGATLSVESVTEGKELDFVQDHLTDYKAETLYRVKLLSANGSPLKTEGRLMRLSIPSKEDGLSVACIDDFNAEIVATGFLNNCLTVETETLRSYALVKAVKSAKSDSVFGDLPLVKIAVIALGALAAVGVAFSALVVVWIRKK